MGYDLLINAPKEIRITAEEFDNLSYFGLSSFFCNYQFGIDDRTDILKVYMKDWKGNYYHTMPRFSEVIPGLIWSEAGMACFNIPKTCELGKTIQKHFKHLYFKK